MTTKDMPRTLPSNGTHGASRHNFVRHFFEMLVAMIAGMVVLGALVSLVFALLGHANLSHYAALRALLMATDMTIGMSVWMRVRGHSWPRVWEMAVAMFAPFILLLMPFWSGLISGAILLVGGHLLMLPCMLGAMLLRQEEYSQDHNHHSPMPERIPAPLT
jgi:hypothetical protein